MTRDSRPRDPYAGRPGALDVDRAFYQRLAERVDDRTLLSRFIVPIRSGKAWVVDAGDLCRIVAIEGPQISRFGAATIPGNTCGPGGPNSCSGRM